MPDGLVTLFLCGDVMLGRGVDQLLRYPGDPELRERYAGDAQAYVRLAERASGPIPRPAGFSWPWGDALDILDMAPDASPWPPPRHPAADRRRRCQPRAVHVLAMPAEMLAHGYYHTLAPART